MSFAKCLASTPESGSGELEFQDFLEVISADSSLSDESHEYYHLCTYIGLHCQIGSPYFVITANATKTVCLSVHLVICYDFSERMYIPNC